MHRYGYKRKCEFTATYWLLYLVHIAINKSYCIQQKNQHTCTVHKLLKNLLKSSQSIGYLWMGTFDLYTCYNLQGIYCTCTYKITQYTEKFFAVNSTIGNNFLNKF